MSKIVLTDRLDPERQKEIWAIIARHTSGAAGPFEFAELIRSNFEAPDSGVLKLKTCNGEDVSVRKMTARTLQKYFGCKKKELPNASPRTWQFFEVVAKTIKQRQGYPIGPRIFNYFERGGISNSDLEFDFSQTGYFLDGLDQNTPLLPAVIRFGEWVDDRCLQIFAFVGTTGVTTKASVNAKATAVLDGHPQLWSGVGKFMRTPSADVGLPGGVIMSAILRLEKTRRPGSFVIQTTEFKKMNEFKARIISPTTAGHYVANLVENSN